MKALLSILVIGSGLLACQKESSPGEVAATLNQSFVLGSKQTAVLPTSGGHSVHVALAAINDSRCPSDATCFVAGYATVDVELTDAAATPQQVRLGLGMRSTPGAAADSALVMLNQQGYWLRLLAVSPYPSLARSNQPKQAVLRLRLR